MIQTFKGIHVLAVIPSPNLTIAYGSLYFLKATFLWKLFKLLFFITKVIFVHFEKSTNKICRKDGGGVFTFENNISIERTRVKTN